MITRQDSTASAAYVTRPGGPPDNGAYMNAAYVVAVVMYAAYIALLLRRLAHARRQSRAQAQAAATRSSGR